MGWHPAGQRSLWWAGLNSEGVFQDDMATLARSANGFGYRADDHAEEILGASPMKLGKTYVVTGYDENYDPDLRLNWHARRLRHH